MSFYELQVLAAMSDKRAGILVMSLMNGLAVVCAGICVLTLVTAIFRWLWNSTMPQVFNVQQISFWVAFRLLILIGLLSSGSFIRFNWHP